MEVNLHGRESVYGLSVSKNLNWYNKDVHCIPGNDGSSILNLRAADQHNILGNTAIS